MNHQDGENTEIRAAFEAGLYSAEANSRIIEITEEDIPVAFVPADMKVSVLDEVLAKADARAERPRRRTGTSTHADLDSFLAHVDRFTVEGSTIWAEPKSCCVTAIYDYHLPGKDEDGYDLARWCKHRAIYTCPTAPEWETWRQKSGHHMSQDEFGDFIDNHLDDLTGPEKKGDGPSPVNVLEMARNLRIHVNGQFERKVDPATGEHSMVCKEEHTQSSTKIHRAFFLALRVFEGGAQYRVEARIRFALRGGTPTFTYTLHRDRELFRDAFADVHKKVAEKTGLPVYIGEPE